MIAQRIPDGRYNVGYSACKNQNGVREGKVRYRFSLYVDGIRKRKQIICSKKIVDAVYDKWERKNLLATPEKKSPLLFQIVDRYCEYSQAVKSPDMYYHEKTIMDKVVKAFFSRSTLLEDVKRQHIEEFIKWRRGNNRAVFSPKEKISNATINRSLSVLSYFFNWCIVRNYYHAVNPCFKTKLKENNIREVRLTPDQLNELLKKSLERDEKLYNVILAALCTGMRLGELLSLNWSEIDFDNYRIFLSRLKTKGKRARIIPIIPKLKHLLLSLKNQNSTSDTVFGVSRNFVSLKWKRFRKHLSFHILDDGTQFRFHDLRHITAQYLLDQNVSLEDIQIILGHQDITTTQRRYAQYARPDLHEKMARLENVIQFGKASNQ